MHRSPVSTRSSLTSIIDFTYDAHTHTHEQLFMCQSLSRMRELSRKTMMLLITFRACGQCSRLQWQGTRTSTVALSHPLEANFALPVLVLILIPIIITSTLSHCMHTRIPLSSFHLFHTTLQSQFGKWPTRVVSVFLSPRTVRRVRVCVFIHREHKHNHTWDMQGRELTCLIDEAEHLYPSWASPHRGTNVHHLTNSR